jgi:hypothetical protein
MPSLRFVVTTVMASGWMIAGWMFAGAAHGAPVSGQPAAASPTAVPPPPAPSASGAPDAAPIPPPSAPPAPAPAPPLANAPPASTAAPSAVPPPPPIDESQYAPYPVEVPPPPPPPRRRYRWAAQVRFEAAPIDRTLSSDAGMEGIGFSIRPRPLPHFAVDFGLDLFGGTDYQGRSRSETTFSINPMFFVNPRSRVQLYLLGGIGFSSAYVRYPADRTTAHFTYVALDGGVGAEFRLTSHLAIDADVVGFVRGRTDSDASLYPEFVEPGTGRTTNASGGALLRLGLAYYW